MYKQSCFNLIFENKDGLLLYNSLSKKYLKSIAYKSQVLEILNNPNKYANNDLFLKLKDSGILVESSLDEFEVMTTLKNDIIYRSDLHICILPTEQCNLRCVYCYEDFQNKSMPIEIQESIIKWLRRNIKNYSGLHINWFGGEPLVAKNIIFSLSERILKICHQAKKPYTASITTNGTLLDLETFQELLKYHVTSYQVTLDGIKSTHDKLKITIDKSGTYDRIIHNLQSISHCVKSAASFKIKIRTNVTKEVVCQLPEHLSRLNEYFGDDKRFTFYFRPVGQWNKEKAIPIKESLINNFESLYTPIINSPVTLDYSVYSDFLDKQICATALRNHFVLRSNGDICKCTMLLNDKNNFIGTLDYDGNLDIDYRKLSSWISSKEIMNKKCKQCTMLPSCFNLNCPAKKLKNNTNSCGYEAESYSYIMKLLDKCEYFELID